MKKYCTCGKTWATAKLTLRGMEEFICDVCHLPKKRIYG